MIARILWTSVLALGLACSAAGQTTRPAQAATQPASPAGVAALRGSLAWLTPANALVFVERAGHDAVRPAFDASLLGKMAHDPEIEDILMGFLREKTMWVFSDGMLDVDTESNGDDRDTMEQLLKVLWNKPSAMFFQATPHDSLARRNFGVICAIPKDQRAEVHEALDALMTEAIGGRRSTTRKPFTWSTGKLTWTGVAYHRHQPFDDLPSDKDELEKALIYKDLLLVCETDDHMLAVTSLAAADALEKTLAGGKVLAAEADFQAVMAKSATENWAFRWHINRSSVDGMLDPRERATADHVMKALGLGNARAVGGVAGYEKKTTVYRTFVLSPKTDGGVLRLFKTGGSHKTALSMVPRTAVVAVAGQADAKAVAAMFRTVVQLETDDDAGRLGRSAEEDDEAEHEPLSEEAEVVLTFIDEIAAGSNGQLAAFLGPINVAMFTRGNFIPPVGFVLGMKNADASANALESFRELLEHIKGGPLRELASKTYREVEIRTLDSDAYAAAMDDRLIVGATLQAVRLAVDAAKDTKDKGGFAKGSKGETYTTLAGNGAGVFFIDLAALAKNFWPLLQMGIASEFDDTDWTLPDTDTLLKYLGPEVAVVNSDPDGLLITGVGLFPFGTLGIGGYGLAFMMMMGF